MSSSLYRWGGLCALAFCVSASAQTSTLYFQTNFETPVAFANSRTTTQYYPRTWSKDITGQDYTASAPDDWVADYEGGSVNGSSIGSAYLNFWDEAVCRPLLASDPLRANNRVLLYELSDGKEVDPDPNIKKGRVQLEHNSNVNWREFHYKVEMLLPKASFDRVRALAPTWGDRGAWLNLAEINAKNPTTDNTTRPSRVQLNISPRVEGGVNVLRWTLTSQDTNASGGYRKPVLWSFVSDAPVITGEWFSLEFYIKQGGNSNSSNPGRVYIAQVLNGTKQVLFNITGPTMSLVPNNKLAGFEGFSNLKTYVRDNVIQYVNASGSNPLRVYWDNYRMYVGTYPWYMGPGKYLSSPPNASNGVVPPIAWVP